jgi:hypothetical protein
MKLSVDLPDQIYKGLEKIAEEVGLDIETYAENELSSIFYREEGLLSADEDDECEDGEEDDDVVFDTL